MNIEIANRLVEMRKKNNLSQEELAAKLGLSRQAVSKWERAEASPDTDNLICLAKIYNMSLDQLLHTDEELKDIVDQKAEKEKESQEAPASKKDYVHIGRDGIHVISKGEEVHISGRGINVKDGKQDVNIGLNGIHIGNSKIENKVRRIRDVVSGITALLVVIGYILIGTLLGLWHPGWILFLAIPIIESLVSVFAYRRITKFAYPVLVVAAYLYIGLVLHLWHPWWVLFLTIPVFYMAFKPLERLWLKDKFVTIDGEQVCIDPTCE